VRAEDPTRDQGGVVRKTLATVLAGCILLTASSTAQAVRAGGNGGGSRVVSKPRLSEVGSRAAARGSSDVLLGHSRLSSSAARLTPDQMLCKGWRYRIERGMHYDKIQRRARNLILCVFSLEGLTGQILTAWYVADRESNYLPWAYNPSGASGLFQHIASYWSGRRMMLPRAQFPNRARVSPFNARANTWVTAIMVRQGGWSPWNM